MIIRDRPNSLRLLLALQGSILPQIMPQLLMVVGLSTLLVALNHWTTHTLHPLTDVPITAFSLIGLTLSIFLVFRNNACYERWWEARKLWGNLIAQVRHLDRNSQLLPSVQRQQLMHYVLVFNYALLARLRNVPLPSRVQQWLSPAQYDALQQHNNPPQYALMLAHDVLVQSLKQGMLSDICYVQLNNHLNECADVQAACDRILTTPLPFAYSLLLHRTAYLFCLLLPFGLAHSVGFFTPLIVGLLAYTFFGLDALGSELEEPFGLEKNDLPLDALLRTMEIDILTGLNAAHISAPLQAVDHVLT